MQNKAIRIINFLPFNSSNINKTYNNLKIPKLPDCISLQNSLFFKDCFENEIPNPFIKYFQKPGSRHSHRTRSAFEKTVLLYQTSTQTFTEKNPSNANALKHGIIPSLSFTLRLSSSFSSLIPYSYSQHSIDPSPL